METYIPFILATFLILIMPGPTIILVVSQAVTHGRKSVAPLVAGVLMGDLTAMTMSLLGLGVLMTTSATLFNVFKWIGTLYLIYLGIKLWRTTPKASDMVTIKNKSVRSLFKSSYIVTALNPKSIAFFVAFLPQFINPAEPALAQLLLLGGTFLILAAINSSLYAIFATKLAEHMKNSKVHNWFNRCGGSALFCAGIITAGMQRS